MQSKTILELYADPLGDLYAEWKIHISIIPESIIQIGLPTYKYEMSYFLGVPVPFSSLAEKLTSEVFKVSIESTDLKIDHEREMGVRGEDLLVIKLTEHQLSLKDKILSIQTFVRNLVTKDKIFFNFVYTLTSPLNIPITAEIVVKAKFSYHISSYRLKTVLIDSNTGRIQFDTEVITHKRVGDYIHGYRENVALNPNGTLDLHVHASRLPLKIDRRYFWIVIFLGLLSE